MLEFLQFILIQPLCMPVLIIILSVFLIPWKYLGLWNAGVIAVWTILLFPLNRPYVDAGFEFFADIFVIGVNFILIMAIVSLAIIRLLNKQDRQKTGNTKLLKFLSSLAYGILAAYYSFLLFTDFWHDYQPAWQAYVTILAGVIVDIVSGFLLRHYAERHILFYKLKDLSVFIYSFASSMIIILVANLIFPIAAIQQTKKIIRKIGGRDTKYCIQSNRKPINSWLHLTPLTAWNKPNGSQGAAIRHAVLVVEKHNKHILYHWSYKFRKWEFTSVGFEPDAFLVPSSLECTPEIDYLNKLPFWFS